MRLLGRDFGGCDLAIRVRTRRASFTDRESRKTRATSGSRRAMLLPAAKRAAYLPRTPPEKLYSGRTSRSWDGRLFFFMLSPLDPRCPAGADYADRISALNVNNNHQPVSSRHSNQNETFLASRLIRVGDSQGQGIGEGRGGLDERNSVLAQVGSSFPLIPLELHTLPQSPTHPYLISGRAVQPARKRPAGRKP